MTLAAAGLIVQLLVSDDCKVIKFPADPVTFQVPPTVVVELPAKVIALAAAVVISKLLKVVLLEPVTACAPAPFNVTIEVLAVKPPELEKLPATFKVLSDPAKVPAVIDRLPPKVVVPPKVAI